MDSKTRTRSRHAVEEVQPPGGLLPPLSANRTAEIEEEFAEEEFAEAKAERRRSTLRGGSMWSR